MRGVESRGMLLAADYKDKDGNDRVEVLTAPWAAPGTPVVLDGDDPAAEKPDAIDADVFFRTEIYVSGKKVMAGGKQLSAGGKFLATEFTCDGGVH